MGKTSKLTKSLQAAADGLPGAVDDFYKNLLSSVVFVPLGEGPGNCLVVEHEGSELIPIFSEEEFLKHWTEEQVRFEQKELKSLIWITGEEIWLYLNPSQEVGKEISPWEIERLRKGEEAIPELVADILGTGETEIEIESGNQAFPELRKLLLDVMNVHETIEEAFLISIKRQDSEVSEPLLGISHRGMKPDKLQNLREELHALSETELPMGVDLTLVDDLGIDGSPNRVLFEDAVPFYFQKNLPGKSMVEQVKSILRRKKS